MHFDVAHVVTKHTTPERRQITLGRFCWRAFRKDVDEVSGSCDSYDFTISIKETEVVYQPAPAKPYKEPTITVKGQRWLQVVDKFTYLGSTLSRVVHTDNEVNARIAKTTTTWKYLGSKWNPTWHKAESIQFRGAVNTIIRMRNLGAYAASQTSVDYEETQSSRVFEFCDFVCSLFPKAILFFRLLLDSLTIKR